MAEKVEPTEDEVEVAFDLTGYQTQDSCTTRDENGKSAPTTLFFDYTDTVLEDILRGFEKSARIEWQATVRDKVVPLSVNLDAKDYCTGTRKQSDEVKFGSLWNRLNEDQRVAMREKYSI